MKEKRISFTSDSQLLAELGERLIATPQIALSELVKNAYDADATRVHIWLSDDGDALNIKDDGHGMAEEDFRNAWMRIAASHKILDEVSPRYKRPLTGSKGVGRFAVRLLGDELLLETSTDGEDGLRATFPWKTFEAGSGIDTKPITYWTGVDDLWTGIDAPQKSHGTLLRVSTLRHSWDHDMLAEVSGYVLRLQTPAFVTLGKTAKAAKATDPGFNVYFSPPGVEQAIDDPTSAIFERSAIALSLTLRKTTLTYTYSFRSGRKPVTYTYDLPDENLIGRADADIRFLPMRPGAFAGLTNFDGREAAAWVRKNAGIRVFDRGFRVPPYGSPTDDWVRLARDTAARRRDWDSEITTFLLPKPGKTPTESEHPALHLPGNHQVIGYVSLRTHNLTHFDQDDGQHILQPSMDRQGFVNNAGFKQLYNIVRGGMEVLAFLDLDEELRRKREARKQAVSDLRDQLDTAIAEVADNPDIPPSVRKSIGRQLRKVQAQAQRTEEARDEAEVAVETLGLLGVVATFMTHEMTTMVREVDRTKIALTKVDVDFLPDSQRERYINARNTTDRAFTALERHIEYVRRFASNVRSSPATRYKSRVAIKQVTQQFEYFTGPRHIDVEDDVPAAVLAPPIPISVYGGLILNLYTNALKAVIAKKDNTERRIRIEALIDADAHVVRVSDTGIGVAPALQSRIFDPLFTTTDDDGPLGPGMGLGLYIVRRVVRSLKGHTKLVTPPDGFSTSIELRFPNA